MRLPVYIQNPCQEWTRRFLWEWVDEEFAGENAEDYLASYLMLPKDVLLYAFITRQRGKRIWLLIAKFSTPDEPPKRRLNRGVYQ